MTWPALGGLLFFIALLSWWGVGRLAHFLAAHEMVDVPNERTLHQGAIARGGGLVPVGFLIVALVVMAFLSNRISMLLSFALLVSAWAALSWWDDRHDLAPRTRVVFQGFFALLLLFAFGFVDQIQVSQHISLPLGLAGALVTWVGVMWFTNLYNFMDGMDGLAASQTIIAAITISIWLWNFGDQGLALICMVLAAASYGFLLRNWHPATIFLGDVGSIGIGAFFAGIIIIGSHRYEFPVLSFVLLFGVFVVDASLTMLRRIARGDKFWEPHRSHYYQRLAILGFRHDKIVLAEIVCMLICAMIATTSLLYRDIIWACVILELGLLGGSILIVSRLEHRRSKDD